MKVDCIGQSLKEIKRIYGNYIIIKILQFPQFQ